MDSDESNYSVDKKLTAWFDKNTFHFREFKNIRELVELKGEKTISVGIPTLNEEETVGKVIDVIRRRLVEQRPLVDEIVVIDSGSTDNTKQVAKEQGAKFYTASKYLKGYEKNKGKGHNLWTSQYLMKGDILCWVDADIKQFKSRFVFALVGPLLKYPELSYAKAFYKRPIEMEGTGDEKVMLPAGGGRVGEICVRPLFNHFFPELSGFIQPTSGEFAGRRELFEQLPFGVGYGIETSLLIDIWHKFGLNVMAQCDLERRIHRNQSIRALSKMSFAIMQVVFNRAQELNRLKLLRDISNEYRFPRKLYKGYYLDSQKIRETYNPPIIENEQYMKKFNK
ncbi:MAG: glucosyl-3-phosphoglycerate synthase [archaeon]